MPASLSAGGRCSLSDPLVPFDLGAGPFFKFSVRKGALPIMSPNARYWTLHWLRVALWPLPILTLFRAGRGALNLMRR
jgi:hypothetical protein